MVKITYPNGSEVRFGYDGLGRRVFRQEGASVRYFYYDGDRIIAEREGNSWVVRYLLGLKSCGHVVSGQIRVYHADRLGSVRWVTDGSGNLVASYVYEGFGKVVGQEGSEVVPYRFCGLWGYRNDEDAGLLHVGARYYEVETGRFIQKDYWLDLNRYSYVENNPIELIDPNGLRPKRRKRRRKKPRPEEKPKPEGEISLEIEKGPVTIGIKTEIDIGPIYLGYNPSSRCAVIGIEIGPFYGHIEFTIPSWEQIKQGLCEGLRAMGMWGIPAGHYYLYYYLYKQFK